MNTNGHVTLPWITLHKAALVGLTRQLRALHDQLADKHGCQHEDGWRIHIEGACHEAAVALYMGWPWQPTLNAFHTVPDLAGMEVRGRSRHSYDLIIRKDDPPNRIYIHSTGLAPHYWIRGWIRGTDAQRPHWWKNHGEREWAWFVPSNELSPMSLLTREKVEKP